MNGSSSRYSADSGSSSGHSVVRRPNSPTDRVWKKDSESSDSAE